MTFKLLKEQAKAIAILGLINAPTYLADKLKEIPPIKYVRTCREFQNKLYKNYKMSNDIYEAYNSNINSIKPVGIECLIVDSDLVPVKSINILTDKLELGKDLFYYQIGPTYGQKVIKGLKKVLSDELSDKLHKDVKVLRFEFRK